MMQQHTKTEAAVGASAAGPEGLSEAEAQRRLAQYGENALAEHHISALERLARFFWGPIPWMIEIAAALSAVLGHWGDLAIILLMLFINAGVGFWQEFKADNAIALLKQRLALKARVKRDGTWKDVEARLLVPGDLILIKLGNIVPADVKLVEGAYLSVDQSALTGESLPVDKKSGDEAYSGSIAKQGEMSGVVTATGMKTYFGKTAGLVQQAGAVSHFQRAVLRIGNFLILTTAGLVIIIIVAGLFRHNPLLELVQFALILAVASIPVALPAVLSVTMAVGAERLARMKAIVSRLVSIEEMAGVNTLCSDKTGTLTKNELTLGDPQPAPGVARDDLLLAGALASRRDAPDAIDAAILAGGPAAAVLDGIDLPGRWYLQAIQQLFKENRLAKGEFIGLGRRLDLRSITCPAYLLAGASDDITTSEQVLHAAKHLGTAKEKIVQKTVPGGHIGLFMGARTLKETWPEIASWISSQ
jgi:H+-transporting ATPase